MRGGTEIEGTLPPSAPPMWHCEETLFIVATGGRVAITVISSDAAKHPTYTGQFSMSKMFLCKYVQNDKC